MYRLLFIICCVTFMASCKTPTFSTANNMRLINGTIITTDGREINGQITANIENSSSRTYISIIPNGSKAAERINTTNIRSMTVRGNTYEPKLIDMGFGSRDQLLFVKRLTKADSRLHLYELYSRRTTSTPPSRYGRTDTRTEDDYSYYLTTPKHTLQENAWNIEGSRLTPNFEDKMSAIVKDCPALADKIRRKEKGYFYAQVSLIQERKVETILNIIDEYNRCAAN